ncbi:3-hydroxy-2-methylbutyryl-CoA dehydrogenase [Chromatiales bacterium (ex Bugula neritina AB1)]|nr:3-hydroxy-2-methylbutyryl-CoA dehydrogenase [Chromatiales bacterium (ex Bugula neritina AB1)]
MKLNETVAIVTGGASGLGEATVREIIAAGGKAAIIDLNEEQGNALADELGDHAIFCKADVCNEQQVTDAMDACVASFGRLTAAVNFAGIAIAVKTLGKDGPHPLKLYQKVIDINLIGTFNVSRLASERMQKNTANEDGELGVIVNTASVAAFDGQKGQSAYGASKAGVAGLTLPMARDLASYGVRVNTIAPGLFLTPMLAALPEEAQEALSKQPLFPKRLGKPAEIAKLACFMIECAYLNAEVIRLDGGIRLP